MARGTVRSYKANLTLKCQGKRAKKDTIIGTNQDPWAFILIQEETQDGLRVRIAPHPAEESLIRFDQSPDFGSQPLIVNRSPSRAHGSVSLRSGAGLAEIASLPSCQKPPKTWERPS